MDDAGKHTVGVVAHHEVLGRARDGIVVLEQAQLAARQLYLSQNDRRVDMGDAGGHGQADVSLAQQRLQTAAHALGVGPRREVSRPVVVAAIGISGHTASPARKRGERVSQKQEGVGGVGGCGPQDQTCKGEVKS